MDVNIIRGAILIGLIIGFLGIWAWAWSRKRKPEFDRAARMPLEEDHLETEAAAEQKDVRDD